MTLTAYTGYHRTGTLVGVGGNFGYGFTIFNRFPDLPGTFDGYTAAHYDSLWRTVTQPINVTWEAGQQIAASGQAGNVDLGATKGAVYVQEFNAWCAWGVHNPSDLSNPYDGTPYFVSVPGSAWVPPASMNGAWDY